jgi:hypothetical protein
MKMLDAATRPGLQARLVTVLIFVLMVLFFVLFDLWISADASYSFEYLVVSNLVLAILLSLFDALFIDYLLLLSWRPAVLHLPQGMPTREWMHRHMRVQFTVGWLFTTLIAVLGAAFGAVLRAAL